MIACAGCGSSHPRPRHGTTPRRARTPHRIAVTPWLGLDYNSLPGLSGRLEFVAHGIVYDREGNIEPPAGALATGGSKLALGLRVSYGAGMVPDIEVDPPRVLEAGCPVPQGCLPTDAAGIGTFVRGFVRTAQSVLRAFPGKPALFEPIDEPWGLGTPSWHPGRRTAAVYAALLARLMAAVARARDPAIPLVDVYVPATGRLPDGSHWVADLYHAQPCLRPGPKTCGPIEGWNVHPYGRPGRRDVGIDWVPGLRADMASGADNVVVSEVGFCALDVQRDSDCSINTSQIDGSSRQTAAWLTQTLREALPMHRAGWLKALLVWARAEGGWSMQLPDGALTAQGRALIAFSDSTGRAG